MFVPELILASSSKYRQTQLSELGFHFRVHKEPTDETPKKEELPPRLSLRLSHAKAYAVAKVERNAIVIGADQVASIGNNPIGKPGTVENACKQLAEASGRKLLLYSAYAIYVATKKFAEHVEKVEIQMRNLSKPEIENYVALDMPLDCAGSFKYESKGALLFESIRTDDSSAIVGLPLIQLAKDLRRAGINPLT